MAAYLQLFGPATAHQASSRKAEFLEMTVPDDKSSRSKDPRLHFSKQDPGEKTFNIINKHSTEAMYCLVFAPLMKDGYDKESFAGRKNATFENKWLLDSDGWRLEAYGLETHPEGHHKVIKVPAASNVEMRLKALNVEPGAYALKVYGWIKGLNISDQAVVSIMKYGTPIGTERITEGDLYAKRFADFCKSQANPADIVSLLDGGADMPVDDPDARIFQALAEVLVDIATTGTPSLSTSHSISSGSSHGTPPPKLQSFSSSSSSRSDDESNEKISSMSSPLSTASLSVLGYGLIHPPPVVQNTKSPAAAVTRQKRRCSGDLFRNSLKAITEAESASDSDQPGPSNKRIRHKDDNSDGDGTFIDFIHTSTSQPRDHENALSDENLDTHIKKNDGCPKCHKTMYGKACLRCQDGCLKWWHTRCFDTTLHYRADEAKARARDGKLLCAACRQGI